jgi:hypothetical protein
MSRDEFLRDK